MFNNGRVSMEGADNNTNNIKSAKDKSPSMHSSSTDDCCSLLETFFENTHLLIAILDADFNFIWVNKAYAIADEKLPEFFPGKNHFELYPDERNEKIFREVVQTGEPRFIYAKPFVYPDNPERGTTYWNWSVTPVSKNREVTKIILTLQNITSRKRAEKQVQEMDQAFDAALEQGNIGILTMDFEGRIIGIRGSIFQKWDVSRRNMSGMKLKDAVPEIGNYIDRTLKGETVRFVYEESDSDLPIFYQCQFFPDKVHGSGIIGIFTQIVNMNDLKTRILGIGE